VPAEVVDPPIPALRVQCSTLSYAGMVPAERIELPTLALQKPCTTAVLRRRNSQTAGIIPAKKKIFAA
jgi:hypothetical protein